ncbi:MAG TPA: ornithine--oxo-acid transaminase [Candidatus Baltobacteraceae bacterium]|nr:ornithine--oxo-acid transaminase [Candidatus Baltobacteraceae bacterium]
MRTNSEATQSYVDLDEKYGAQNYSPLDLVVEHAEGVWLYDVDGKRYLDCISAYSAVNQGHCHPRIYAAVVAQASKLSLTSRALRNARMGRFLKKLTALTGFDRALLMNTGVEAVETAIKLARRWGYEQKGIPDDAAEVIVFANNFHGRTMTAISASTNPGYRRHFGPFTPGFVFVEYGNAEALERAITPNTCAILIEPIQGEGGVIVPREGFLKRAWALCREHKVLFAADEIQTGLGRTGDLFACDFDNIKPDLLILGKALGGGYYPISAVLANKTIMSLFRPGDHGSTFGGNPLACAIGEAALDVIVDEKLASRARYAGAKVLQGIRAAASPAIKEVRGRGLLIGIELTIPAKKLVEALLERGIAAKDTQENVLRIAPPLVIDDAAIDFLLTNYREAVRTV